MTKVREFVAAPPRLFAVYSRLSEAAEGIEHRLRVLHPRHHVGYVPVALLARASVRTEKRESTDQSHRGYLATRTYDSERLIPIIEEDLGEDLDPYIADEGLIGLRIFTGFDETQVGEAWDRKAREWWARQIYDPPSIRRDDVEEILGVTGATWGRCPHCDRDEVLVPAMSVPQIQVESSIVCEVCRRPADRGGQ